MAVEIRAATYAALRAALAAGTYQAGQMVFVESIDGTNTNGAGIFKVKFDAGGGFVDDGGVTIASADGKWAAERVFDGPVNVRWFGATGDGVTDDTAAVLAGINAAAALGMALYLPPGTYACSAMAPSAAIRLNGVGTLDLSGSITVADAAGALELSGISITADNTIGINHASGGTALSSVDVQNISVTGGSGIRLQSGATKAVFKNNTFNSLYAAGSSRAVAIQVGSNSYAVSEATEHILVEGNTIDTVYSEGSLETHGVLIYGHSVRVIGNTVKDVSNSGGVACEAIYTKAVASVITGNTVVNCGPSDDGCITMKGQDEGDVSAPNGHENVCANNVIRIDDGTDNIKGIVCNTSNTLITGNYLHNAWLNIFSCDGVDVIGNRVFLERPSGSILLFEVENASNISMQNNTFHGIANSFSVNTAQAARIRCSTATGPIENITIKGGAIKAEYPDLTTGANTVAALNLWAESEDILGFSIDGVEMSIVAGSIASDLDRNALYLNGANNISFDFHRCSFDGEALLYDASSGTVTKDVSGNDVSGIVVTTTNKAMDDRSADNVVRCDGSTAARTVTLPAATAGVGFKFHADDATYGMIVSRAGSDTFVDAATSKTLAVGASMEVRCYAAGKWAIVGSHGTIT